MSRDQVMLLTSFWHEDILARSQSFLRALMSNSILSVLVMPFDIVESSKQVQEHGPVRLYKTKITLILFDSLWIRILLKAAKNEAIALGARKMHHRNRLTVLM